MPEPRGIPTPYRNTKWFRKRFLTRSSLLVACSWRAAMSIVQLSSSQRRKLRGQLRRAADASYYRRVLAILELDRGKPVAGVAASLGVTRQSVYNWAHAFAACPDPATLHDRYGVGRPSAWTQDLRAL